MSRTFDFPKTFQDDEGATLLLDANFSVYQPRDVSDGVVYVEKHLVRKGKFVPIEKIDEDGNLITSSTHTNAYLVDETNFQDIGGGLQTFERHYATIPSSWYDFQEVSYRTVYWGAINWRTRQKFGGASWHTQRNVLAKANRYYFLESELPANIVPENDNQAILYASDFTKIYAQEPEGRLGYRWENYTPDANNPTTVVIAPDRVQKYMGHIYEFIRYTIEV